MSLHKLSAGDGYTYLTRQVPAADDTNRGYGSLGAYYEQKGESPGVWLGSGLESLGGSVPEFRVSGAVTEAEITSLFGEGRHPNADVDAILLAATRASDPRLTHDPHWQALARQLDNAHREGVEITAVARHAASERLLPDEQPAAALHWRLVDAIAESRRNQSA